VPILKLGIPLLLALNNKKFGAELGKLKVFKFTKSLALSAIRFVLLFKFNTFKFKPSINISSTNILLAKFRFVISLKATY
jgi:hypothetical protein